MEAEPDPDESGRIRSGKLAGKTLSAAIAILALPVLVEQLANATVGFVDQALAGRLPGGVRMSALDAIGVASYVDWFISLSMATVGVGGAAIIARAIGAGDRDLAHETLRQSVILSVLWGCVVGLALWLAAPWLALFSGLSSEATGHCVDYIRVQAWGLPLVALMQISMMCLHGAGETVRPFFVMLVVNVVNVLASWLLSGVEIAGIENPSGLNLQVVGIALGTVVGKGVGAALILVIMRRGVKDLRLEGSLLQIRRDMAMRIGRIGLPSFAEGLGMWLGNFAALGVVGLIAHSSGQTEGLMGAHIIAIRWEAFSFLPGYAMGVAGGALAGQFLGAGNPRQARRAVLACTSIAMVFMGLLGVGMMLWGRPLTALISTEPIHLDLAPQLLWVIGTVQVFFAIAMVMRNSLRGVGDTRVVLVITVLSVYLVRLPLCLVLGYFLSWGLVGIWVASGLELVVRAMLFAARFFQGGWSSVSV